MGYESKILVVLRHHHKGQIGKDYAELLATVNLSKMRYEFVKLFDKDIDFDMYLENTENPLTEDKYGDTVKYTDLKSVIDYLKNEIKEDGDKPYRRSIMLLNLLRAFKNRKTRWQFHSKGDFAKIQIIHYGY